MKKNKIEILFILLSIVIAFTYSVYERYKQLDVWKTKSEVYFADNLPSVSTMDAYYWLRYAQDEISGNNHLGSKDLRGFPETLDYPKNIPIFSKFLAYTYKYFSPEEYNHLYMGSIKVSIFLASLFIIPLIIYVYLAEAGLGGLLGSLIGTFGVAYYERTSVGRIDTDGLLMFVPFMVGLILLIASKTNRIYLKYILTVIIAFIFYLFSGLHLAVQGASVGYLVIFILGLMLFKTPKKHILGIIITYIVCMNPMQFYQNFIDFINFINSAYINGNTHSSLDAMSKTIETVAEARKVDFESIINSVIKNKFLFYAGMAATVALFIIKFKNMIFLLPIFAVGLFSFVSANRFSIFLSPFVGLGFGFIIWQIFELISKKLNLSNIAIKHIASFTTILVFFFATKGFTGIGHIPAPSLPVNTVKVITDLKSKLSENSVIYTWWDLGYPLEALGNFTTISDGGLENIENRFVLASGYFAKNQDELYRLISYISNEKLSGIREIIANNDKSKFKEILSQYDKPIPSDLNIYVLYSDDLLEKLYSMSKYAFLTIDKDDEAYYNFLKCAKYSNGILYCNQYNIDMKNGFLIQKGTMQKIPLYKITRVDNGYETRSKIYNPYSKYYISVLTKGKKVYKVLLYTHDIANTAFHKQYIQGRAGDKFTEIYNAYPFVRVFRVHN